MGNQQCLRLPPSTHGGGSPLRPLMIGISLLALLSGLAPAAVAEVINPFLAFGGVPWDFSTQTNTFSGEGGGGSELFQITGQMELRAIFDDEGNFRTGTFQYRAPDNHLLLQATLSGAPVEAVPDGDTGNNAFYRVRFGLIVHHDDLPFPVDGGTFEAYVCDPRSGCPSGPTSIEDVFTTDYTDAAFPINNYLITFHDVRVPAPVPGILLGVGVVILVAMRLRRLT